jgi:hypothetical protein
VRAVVLVALIASAPAVASADLATAPETLRPTKIDVGPLVPRKPGVLPAEPSSRLIYVQRCPETGCVVRFGPTDDSRTNTSQIAEGIRTIGRFRQSDAVWDAMMSCVRATYAPFDILVTDVDPGNVPHYKNIVGGRPQDLRSDFEPGVGGVAPFRCAEIPNAISYTFDVWGPDSNVLCYVVAQETAHAFGLEHEMNNRDPLTYLTGPFPKRFQADDAPCGEYQNRPCQCGGTTQNSYEHILAMFGPGVPTAPSVEIRAPASGKKVQPGFIVKIAAEDDVAVDRVELHIDGALVGETRTEPYRIAAPLDLPLGPHVVEAVAYDIQGTPGSSRIDVELGPPCTAASGCEGTDVCVMGGCVAGPDQPGGLGNFCQVDRECLSDLCAASTNGERFCVEACDVALAGSCPSGFSCIAAGDGGICWPAEGGGCCDAGGSRGLPAALLGFGVVVLVLRSRR